MSAVVLVAALLLRQTQGVRPATVIPVIDEAPTKAGSYDWMARHQAVLDRLKKGNVDLIFVGDSITHGFGGDPENRGQGQPVWEKYYAPRNAVNLGFGWDGTEHVLWRFEHGELDGIRPKVAVVLIGVNNLPRNTVEDTVTGVTEVVHQIRKRLPRTKVLLLGIFPWTQDPNSAKRQKVVSANAKLAELGKERGVTFLDLGSKFVEPDGTLSREIMPDFLHPNRRGYEIWAAEMEPTLAKLMGERKR